MAYLGGTKTLYAAAVFVALFVAFNVRPFAQYFNGMIRLVILIGVLYLAHRYQLFMFPVGGAADAIRHQCGLADRCRTGCAANGGETLTGAVSSISVCCVICSSNMMMLYSGGWFRLEPDVGAAPLSADLPVGRRHRQHDGASPGKPRRHRGSLHGGCNRGLVAAEAVWVVFNGKYLPRRMQQEWWNNLSVKIACCS